MFPITPHDRPAALKMWSTRYVVDVLPFVPVTPIIKSSELGLPNMRTASVSSVDLVSVDRSIGMWLPGGTFAGLLTTTALHPLRIASGMKLWPSICEPSIATKRVPGRQSAELFETSEISTALSLLHAPMDSRLRSLVRVSRRMDRFSVLRT